MAREIRFGVADIDVGRHFDSKVIALWRHVAGDADLMNAAMVLHEAVILASWREAQRVPAEAAAPFWMIDVTPAAEALRSVGLLDDDDCLPMHAWRAWFDPALKRMLGAKRRAMFGGHKRHGRDTKEANARADRQIEEVSARVRGAAFKAEPSRPASSIHPSVHPSDHPVGRMDDDFDDRGALDNAPSSIGEVVDAALRAGTAMGRNGSRT